MNGSFDIYTSNQYIIGTVSWYEYNVDKVNNTSWVHAELRLSRTNNYVTYSSTGGYGLSIEGQYFYEAATADKKISYYSNTLMVSGDVQITHDSNGSKIITVAVDGNTSNLTISYQASLATLTTIPRASTLSFGEVPIGSLLSITVNRADSSFTHTLNYTFGNLSGTIATNVGASYNWEIPIDFYTQIPNSTNGTGTISCLTYSGGNLIGTTSYTFRVWCSGGDCIPILSATLEDSNDDTIELTGSSASNPILVDYKSVAKLTLNYQAKNSASISQVLINGQAQQIGTIYNLINVPFTTISIQIIDSRGYSNSIVFQSSNSEEANYFKRIPYVELSINPTTSRSSQIADDMFVSINGNYYKGTFNDTNSNSLSLSWKVREKNGTWANGETLLSPTISDTENKYNTPSKIKLVNPISDDGTWDYQKIYEFEFTAVDKLMSKIGSDIRPKGQYNFAIFKNDIISSNGMPMVDFDMLSRYPLGEFVLWEGDKEVTMNGSWQYLGEYYWLKQKIESKFPVDDGFKRKMKLCIESTDNLQSGMSEYIKLAQGSSYSKEYLFPNVSGGVSEGIRTFQWLDFDYDNLPSGHITFSATPSFSATGRTMRIYRIYLLIFLELDQGGN